MGDAQRFVTQGNQLIGLLTLRDLCQTPQEQWEATTVGQVMVPLSHLHAVAPHQSVHEVNQVPVVEGGQLVGVVSREDLLRLTEVRRMLGLEMEENTL